ncbi:MAG: DUF971 domain-containing protein, partial [Phycisphaerales bacterium]|nr:DUF971 domain-containing protein [Phycisphaerales bacterium]
MAVFAGLAEIYWSYSPGAKNLVRFCGAKTFMNVPVNLQLIGQEVAIAWDDGTESYFTFERLRAASPSAANIGERDVLGNQYGGDGPKRFPGVTVLGWERVGNYAIRFDFSDGHRTGLYSFDYLRALGA